MVGVLVKKIREHQAAQAAGESAAQKRNFDARVTSAKELAGKMNQRFDLGIELDSLTKREGRLIGYIESVKNNTLTPAVKERADLQVDADLNGKNHDARIAEIDKLVKETRVKMTKLAGELAEVQAEIVKLAEQIERLPVSRDIGGA